MGGLPRARGYLPGPYRRRYTPCMVKVPVCVQCPRCDDEVQFMVDAFPVLEVRPGSGTLRLDLSAPDLPHTCRSGDHRA